jgi:hypothetical protein
MSTNQFYILVATICFAGLAGYFFVFRVFMRVASFVAKAVLVIILVVASAIFVPEYINNASGGKTFDACRSNGIVISRALEDYAAENSGLYPPSLSDLVPHYIDMIPKCPEADLDTYSHTYTTSDDCRNYTFQCSIKNHQKEVFAGKH